MGKILINLLPPEIAIQEKQINKKNWVIKITSLVIVLVIAITSVALGFSVVKTSEEQQSLQELEKARSEIASLNNQEGYLNLIKQKLTKISTLKDLDTSQISALNLISNLIPEGIQLASLSVGKNSQVTISGQSGNIEVLNSFFNNLTNEEKNNGKISKVAVGNLSATRDKFKFDLTLSLK